MADSIPEQRSSDFRESLLALAGLVLALIVLIGCVVAPIATARIINPWLGLFVSFASMGAWAYVGPRPMPGMPALNAPLALRPDRAIILFFHDALRTSRSWIQPVLVVKVGHGVLPPGVRLRAIGWLEILSMRRPITTFPRKTPEKRSTRRMMPPRKERRLRPSSKNRAFC